METNNLNKAKLTHSRKTNVK